MANVVRYQLRSDEAANWEAKNSTLLNGELGYDKTNRRIKFGHDNLGWNELEYIAPDVVDDLKSHDGKAALSANKGRELDETISKVQQSVNNLPAVVNTLTSASTDAPLSANMGRVLDETIAVLRTLVDTKASREEVARAISELEFYIDNAIDNLPDPETIDVIDNLESTDGSAALSANQGRVLNESKISYDDILNLNVKELEELSSYTSKQVPSIGTVKLLQKSMGDVYVLLANVLKTATYSAIRSAATSNNNNYASQSIIPSMRVIKNIVNTIDGYITTLQNTVSKLYSEQWTFTLEDGSSVTKRVSLWTS